MEELTTETSVPEDPDILGEATPVPWYFTCAIWIPTFAVILWVMLWFFGARGRPSLPEVPPPEEEEPETPR